MSRHRRFQIIITAGVSVSVMLALFMPHLSTISHVCNLAACLVWIWE